MQRVFRFLVFLSVTSFLFGAGLSRCSAQGPEEEVEGLVFSDPFAALSASEIESKLIVFLITDDDSEIWTRLRLDRADKARLGVSMDVWCGREFRRAFQKLFESRPDLKGRCIAQRIAAGIPMNLRGDVPSALPKRAIVAICDGQYRLLNFSVGVPDAEDLVYQIEDAEENQALLNLHQGSVEKVTAAVIERTKNRVRRLYGDALSRLEHPMSGDESLYDIDEAWILKYAAFVSEIRPSYLYDVKLRFGLDAASDFVRLLVLEQHCETRRNWCDVVAPYLVGRPARDLINPLTDITWAVPAVIETEAEEHEEVLRWFDSQRKNDTLVLAVKTTYLDRNIAWPPHDLSGKVNSKQDWNALETVLSKYPFRTVTAEQLSVVLRENDEPSVDLFGSSRVRYVVFELGKNLPMVIRESDVPVKYVNRLKRD